MQIGIIGLPFTGKTTVFNAVAAKAVKTTEHGHKETLHKAVVKVSDPRLGFVASLFKPKKVTTAEIEYIDIAGLTGTIKQKESAAAEIPSLLHQVDAIAQVVRLFRDPAVLHISGSVNPRRDIEHLNLEIFMADLLTIEKRMERVKHGLKMGKKELHSEEELLVKCRKALEANQPLRSVDFTLEEERILRGFGFLSIKPMLYLLNIDEADLGQTAQIAGQFQDLAQIRQTNVYPLCAKIEMELEQLAEEERGIFLAEYGIKQSALEALIRLSFDLLGLVTFYTGNESEVRAWTIPKETSAHHAAGCVHSDMQHGFIRAEVVSVKTLQEMGSIPKAKEKGLLRLEGKEYKVQDGDLILFRFNI